MSQAEATREAASAHDAGRPPGPHFVVTVGTDHHPFDRLIQWVNDWLAAHPGFQGSFFVQSGSATIESAAQSEKFLDSAGLNRALDEADVTICHGGPGSIADAWQRGQVPIAIPRLRKLGEAVDDHQVDFCRKLAGTGRVRIAEDPAGLSVLIEEALADRSGFRLGGSPATADATVAHTVTRFEELVNDLVSGPRRRLPLISRGARRARRGTRAGTKPETGAGEPAGTNPADLSLGRTPARESRRLLLRGSKVMRLKLLPGRALVGVAVAAVAALPVVGIATAQGAQAAPGLPASGTGPGQSLSAAASSSWQTNDIVWALGYANGVVYVGGQFTSVRPPGDPKGTGEVGQAYLAAFSSSTGSLISSFNPTLDGKVTAIAVSPDGSTVYVGGSFTHVNGNYHAYLAAFDTSTGTLINTWKPSATASVTALAVSPDGSEVYIGGNFGKIDGVARNRVGAVTASGAGTIEPWAPAVNGSVTTIAVAPDDSRVLIGGYFSTFNGVTQQAIGSTNPVDGSSEPWALPSNFVPNYSGCVSTVKDIIFNGSTAYVAAEGTGGGCFDGDFAVDASTGNLVWQNDCLGATQSLVVINGLLYKGSHAHDCAYSPGGFPQVSNPSGGWVTHRLLAQSLSDGSIGHWNPNTNGNNLGPRVMATDGTNMFLGGDFTTVNNVGQQGFAIFRPSPDGTAPTRPGQPVVTSTSVGVDSISFVGSADNDDGTLTYRIYRDGGASPIANVTATSWPYALPVIHYRDVGLAPGSTHTYKVSATDGTKGSSVSATSAPVTVSSTSPSQSYAQTVLTDNPSFFWKLDETSGNTAADSSPNGFSGIYEPGTTQGQAGPITGDPQTATSFDGQSGLVTSASQVSGPNTFSIEGWFNTNSNTGGKLIGFGDNQTGMSGNYDRHIYMMNDGQLVFGVWTGQTQTIESPQVYNDGQWHYVVATMGSSGMALYVDGQLVGTNPTTSAQAFNGYWRVGGDNLNGWNLDPWGSNSQGTTEPYGYYFNGIIGDVAVYPYALSASQVAAHYAANALEH